MNTIFLLVVSLWARPQLVPVGMADIERAAAIEQASQPVSDRVVLPVEGAVPNRLVIGYDGKQFPAALAAWLAASEARVLRVDAPSGFVVVEVGADAACGLRSLDGVRYVEPDYVVRAAHMPNDPYFLTYQWDKWVMYADEAWDLSTGSSAVKVGVVDNGCDYTHPDLAANFRAGDYGYDFVGGDADPRPDNGQISEAFHGTHVSGIIAAVIDNSIGVAGWAQAQLLAVRVLNDSGSGMTSDLASGIRWAADNGCRVINMSLTASAAPTDVIEACSYAVSLGCLLFAASGNDSAATIGYPAALSTVVAVGATDQNSHLAWYSNWGPEQEVVAPGSNVVSTAPSNTYVEASGTSMATPEVTGVAALMFGADAGLTAARVRSFLAASAIDMGASGRDAFYGYGMVNGRRALDLVLLARRDGVKPLAGTVARATVVGHTLQLPGWVSRANVYDASGRLVTARQGRANIELGSGVYVARLSGGARAETLKLVVVD